MVVCSWTLYWIGWKVWKSMEKPKKLFGQPDILYMVLFYFLNWSIVDLQSCVNFYCTANWFSYMVKKMWYTETMAYLSAIKKKETTKWCFLLKGHTEDKYHPFSTRRETLSRSLLTPHHLEACLAHREHLRSKHWVSKTNWVPTYLQHASSGSSWVIHR